jgi:hypothetical protein
MMSAMTTAPPEFAQLCETLYGDVLDPDAVWEQVHKAAPDQVDVHAQRSARIRRNVERGSNAVGITAGSLGLAGALKDDRLDRRHNPSVGRVGRALHATGKKMPRVLSRLSSGRVQAGLATGAVATQVANLGGDALIAGTLSEKKKPTSKADVAKFKVPGVGGDIRLMAGNVQQLWNPELAHGSGISVPKAARGGPRAAAAREAAPKPAAPKPKPFQSQTRAGVKAGRKYRAGQVEQASDKAKHQAIGMDVGTALGTTTGKVALGGAGVVGANKMRSPRGTGGAYDPYMGYAKREADVVFRGEFSKFDDAKMQAFGWASVVEKDGSPIVDKQGDYITIEDLEDAGYAYVHKSRVGGDMHRRDGEGPAHVSDMIESMIFTPEKIEKMGLPQGFPQGWWVGYQIHDPATWEEVRKRGRTGFSIHGKGLRKDHDLDELMGYR